MPELFEFSLADELVLFELFCKWGCGDLEDWSLSSHEDSDQFGLSKQRVEDWQRPALRFWHGTSLENAVAILSGGFVVGTGTDSGNVGLFGVASDSHNDYHITACICRRHALEREQSTDESPLHGLAQWSFPSI